MTAAIHELRSAGFEPVAWEVPHYAASQIDYEAFAEVGELFYHRALYFADAGPAGAAMLDLLPSSSTALRGEQSRPSALLDGRREGGQSPRRVRNPFRGEIAVAAAAAGAQVMLGQFFPYVIQQDVYGQKLAPENLDYIEPEASSSTPSTTSTTSRRRSRASRTWATSSSTSRLTWSDRRP
jgi:uncharacterized protein YdaL